MTERIVLNRRKNYYGEYVVRDYRDGKYYEEATYYTDDWDDAVGTFTAIVKQFNLEVIEDGPNRLVAEGEVEGSAKEINDAAGEPLGKQAQEAIDFIKGTRCEVGEAIECGERDRGLFVRISRPISDDTVAFGVVFLNGERIFKTVGEFNEVRIRLINFLKDTEGWIEPEPQDLD